MMRLALPVSALLLVAGCSSSGGSGTEALLQEHGLEDAGVIEVVDQLDRTNEDRTTGLSASVTYDSVLLEDGEDSAVLAMPEDKFYLSVAPWTTTTHDCFHHSLTGCQGELANTEVQVLITDDSGTVIVDESVSTFDNGFVGFWLPKDISGNLEITAPEGTATGTFSTFADSPTCITTLQLT